MLSIAAQQDRVHQLVTTHSTETLLRRAQRANAVVDRVRRSEAGAHLVEAAIAHRSVLKWAWHEAAAADRRLQFA